MKWIYLFVIILLNFDCLAQSTFSGNITDEASKPVAGATITILNTNYSTTSDENGNFRFSNLIPATYTVYISAIGFAGINSEVAVNKGSNIFSFQLLPFAKRLEEVVVSALKKDELLLKLPLTITALTAKKVEDYRLWNINEITAIVPNFYSSHPGDNRNVTSIRGVTNTSYDQAVATYVDGVNQFGLDTYIPHLFDIERIEILKGPQSTLYGRNAMGGVINIITKKPGNNVNGFAEVNIGNYSQQRYSAGIRIPVIKEKVFIGAAGLLDQTDGFYINEFNNSNYDKRRSVTGNYFLKFTPNTKTTFSLNAKHNNNRNNGPFTLVFGVEEAFNKPFKVNQNAITKLIDDVFNSSFSFAYAGSNFNLNSQTSYQSNYRYYTEPIDADFSPLDAISIINNYGNKWNNVKVVTQDITIQSSATKNRKFNWLAGSYLFYQDNPVKQETRFGEQAQMLGVPDKNFSLITSSKAESSGAALYGQVSYFLNSNFQLTAGLRYDHEKREQQVLGEYQKDPDPDPAFAFRTDTAATVNFSALSPKASIAFYPANNQTLYLTYSRGFRAGGLSPLSSDPSQPALFPFKPEFSNNTELGWKQSLLNQKLIFNIAVFYTTISDVQVPTLILPDAVTITRNTGKLTSKGIEAEIKSLIFNGLAIDYSFGYTNAKYNRLKISQNGDEVDLRGKRQLFTPDLTSMLAAQYSYFINKRNTTSLVVRGEWKYIGTQYFDLANNIKQPSFHLLNSRIGIAAGKTNFFFWARNITNKRYISFAYDFGAVHLGDATTFGVSLMRKF